MLWMSYLWIHCQRQKSWQFTPKFLLKNVSVLALYILRSLINFKVIFVWGWDKGPTVILSICGYSSWKPTLSIKKTVLSPLTCITLSKNHHVMDVWIYFEISILYPWTKIFILMAISYNFYYIVASLILISGFWECWLSSSFIVFMEVQTFRVSYSSLWMTSLC